MLGHAALGEFSLGQVEAVIVNAYSVTASAGAFTLTGVSSGLAIGYNLVSGAGAFSVSGQAVGFKRDLAVIASTGSFLFGGVASGLLATRVLYPSHQVSVTQRAQFMFAALGEVAFGEATNVESVQNITFTFVGQDILFGLGKSLPSDVGAYTLTGNDVGITADRFLSADVGAFAWTGQNAVLKWDRVVIAGVGSFTVTGPATDLSRRSRKILAFPRNGRAGAQAKVRVGRPSTQVKVHWG